MDDIKKIDRDLTRLTNVMKRVTKSTAETLQNHKEVIARLEQRISDLERIAKAQRD